MVRNGPYPAGFYFELAFGGFDAAFQEITGLTREMATEDVVCGGENRYKYRLPGVVSGNNLVLRRAVVPIGSPLIYWCASSLNGSFARPLQTVTLPVSLLDASGLPCMVWVIHNAYPVKYQVSDLKAQENALLIETIELAYTFFETLPRGI